MRGWELTSGGWFSVPNSIFRYYFPLYNVSKKARLIYIIILMQANNNEYARISLRKLCLYSGYGKDAAIEALRELRDKGFLRVEKMRGEYWQYNVYYPTLPEFNPDEQIITGLDDILPKAERYELLERLSTINPDLVGDVMSQLRVLDQLLRNEPKQGNPATLRQILIRGILEGDALAVMDHLKELPDLPRDILEQMKKTEDRLEEEYETTATQELLNELLSGVGRGVEDEEEVPSYSSPVTHATTIAKNEAHTTTPTLAEPRRSHSTATLSSLDPYGSERVATQQERAQQAKEKAHAIITRHPDLAPIYARFSDSDLERASSDPRFWVVGVVKALVEDKPLWIFKLAKAPGGGRELLMRLFPPEVREFLP